MYKRPEKQNLHKWCAVKPIPNPENKRVDFELVKGRKGKGTTIIPQTIQKPIVEQASSLLIPSQNSQDSSSKSSTISNHHRQDACATKTDINLQAEKEDLEEYNPDDYNTISRGVGKCPNCGNVIDNEFISSPSQESKLGHQLYAVAYKKGKGSLEFTTPRECDLKGVYLAESIFFKKLNQWEINNLISHEPTPMNPQYSMIRNYGITEWMQCFNPRQLLTLVTYVEIINEVKALIQAEYEWEKAQAISTYLALVLDRCADKNCRLGHWHSSRAYAEIAMAQHALNLNWNYPETNGVGELWNSSADNFASDYKSLCNLFGTKPGLIGIPGIKIHDPKSIQINSASADNLTHIPEKSVDAIVIDPPYYGTIPYADLADFFYVWLKRTLGDIFPELFYLELTDKDREAVANPSRFRNMGISPEQRLKKRAFSVIDTEFSARFLVDGLHAIIAIYQEEGNTEPVRRFLKSTGLVSNDLFMRSFEVALKVIPRIKDEKKRIPEEKALSDLWLAMDEIKAKVSYKQTELTLSNGQMSLNLEDV